MPRKKTAAVKPPTPTVTSIPAAFQGSVTRIPMTSSIKPAQSISSSERMNAFKQMREQKTAATHTALFGTSGMGQSAGSVNPSSYTNPYTHNFPVDILERPQSRHEQIEWNVRWYRENPIVRRVIDLHSQLPLSKLTISKPSSRSQAFSDYIHTFFMDMVRRMQMIPKLRSNVAKAYWLHGDDMVFLEDQKLQAENNHDSEFIAAPTETDNAAGTNFFNVHNHVHKSAQRHWDAKYASVVTNPILALVPNMMGKAMAGAPARPSDPFLSERDCKEVFGQDAYGFLKTVHILKDAAYELRKFADTINGKKTASLAKVSPQILTRLGPEFLSFEQHKAYVAYKTGAISKHKVAADTKEDEGPSDVDMALDPAKRPVFKLLALDPINVEHIPRNTRSVSPTPNLDFQQFLQDNPKIQNELAQIPDPNRPVQTNAGEQGVNVKLFGPDGVSPMDEGDVPLDTTEPEPGMGAEDGAMNPEDSDPAGLGDIGGSGMGGDMPIPDVGPMSPEDDPEYAQVLEMYNKNLKRKKELLEQIIEELKNKEADYKCFANVKYPKYKGWQAMRSLPPHQVEVSRKSNSDVKEIFYIPSEEEGATIQANFENLSEEAQALWKTKKRLILSSETQTGPSKLTKDLPDDGSYCVQVSNSRADYDLYGHGLVEPCLRDLILDDKIGQVKSQTFARNMQPKRLITADGVDEMVLQKLQDMVDASTVDPDVSILTNYAVTWSEMGIGDRLQSFEGEHSHILTNMTAGLAFFQEFITGVTTYGGSKTPQEIMNTMYMAFREDIAFFVEECIFRPVAERKGFYDVDDFGNKVLIYPKVSFSRLAIRDAGETYDMLLNLYMKGSVSISRIYEVLNIDEEEETQKLQDELFTIKDPKFTDLMTNIYQNVAQIIVDRTDIAEILAKRMGLTYSEEEKKAGSDDEGGMPI